MEIVWYGIDAEADPGAFDTDRFIDQALIDLQGVDGITSSSDYPGCLVAALIAERLRLPGSPPEGILRAAHKYYARESFSRSTPKANPGYRLVDVHDLDDCRNLDFPIFVKPVKSWFSQFAQQVESFEDLQNYARAPALVEHLDRFVRPLNRILSNYPEFEIDAGYLIAEEILIGRQVTVEGYALDGSISILGVVDSEFYPGTRSFKRFVTPTTVGDERIQQLAEISAQAVAGMGINHGLFNIEFIFDPDSRDAYIVEVNPRMCGQFADLMEHVAGINTYEILFDLALGLRPQPSSSEKAICAASYPLRHFSDATVLSAPDPSTLTRVRQRREASLVWVYYNSGDRLRDRPKHFDGQSYRYACVNLTARSREELDVRIEAIEGELGVAFDR